jgi:PAS domain S-box-containing protein
MKGEEGRRQGGERAALEQALDAAAALVFSVDREGRLVAMRGGGMARLGLDAARLGALVAERRAAFEDAAPAGAFEAALARAWRGHAPSFALRWRGAELTCALVAAEPDALHAHGWMVPVLRDPDAANTGLQTVINQVAGMVYRCRNDEAWTMDLVSEGCLAVTGYTADELRFNAKVAFADLIHPDDSGWLWEKCQANLAARRFCSNQYRITDASGQLRWVWDRAQGVYADDGTLRFIEGLVTDITADKQAEARRQALEAQLRHSQKMEIVGQLAGGIAHDFNNLLLAIGANLQLALRRDSADPIWRADVEQALLAVERSTELTGQLSAYGRRSPGAPRALDLNELIARHLRLLDRLLPASVVVELELAAALPAVYADAGQVEQVVANLVLNARDAMPEGGVVRVATHTIAIVDARAPGAMPVRPGSYVELVVSDTGVGIPADQHDRVFEPFYTTKPAGRGTGLGLALVQSIVTGCGGYVTVESTPGAGATFRVRLPAHGAPIDADAPTVARPEPPRGHGELVLVVDDHQESRRALSRTLCERGYAVVTASAGEQALACVRQTACRVIVLDLGLPDMSGTELVRRLRAAGSTVPVIFMTGSVDVAMPHDARPSAGLLLKPYTGDALHRLVHDALAR